MNPEQENIKPMSTLRKYISLSLTAVLALVSNASAGLYGFSQANPPTREEKTLDLGTPPRHIINFRQKMRANIDMLADYAHSQNPDFQIVLHEGEELLNKSLWEHHLEGYNKIRNHSDPNEDPSFLYRLPNNQKNASIATEALPAFTGKLNAIALNNVFCGSRKLSNVIKQSKLRLIAIDRCPDTDSYEEALQESLGEKILFYGFSNPDLAFNNINYRQHLSENAKNIFSLHDAKNILIVTDDSRYAKAYDFIRGLQNSNYDVIVIPALFHGKHPFSPADIQSLKFKKNGTTRLVLAEINISEASPQMYYWKKSWKRGSPDWLVRPSYVDKDAFIVEYWHPEWRRLLGNHLQGIIRTGFNGIFLTGSQNHTYFEKQLPLE